MSDESRLVFRFADANDADKLARLVNSTYRGESGRRGWTSEAHFIDGQRVDPTGVRELIERKGSVVLVAAFARAPERAVGCVHLESRASDAFFGMLAVDVEAQGQGVGAGLVAKAASTARERWGSRTLSMSVISIRSELIRWYEGLGFVRTGETLPFPYGDERFGRPLVKGLCFEIFRRELTEPATY